jgi:hypothetical protein
MYAAPAYSLAAFRHRAAAPLLQRHLRWLLADAFAGPFQSRTVLTRAALHLLRAQLDELQAPWLANVPVVAVAVLDDRQPQAPRCGLNPLPSSTTIAKSASPCRRDANA